MAERDLGRIQEEISEWSRQTTPPHKRTPAEQFSRSLEEVAELSQAIQENDGSPAARHEIAMEGIDVMIRMIGLIAIVGGDAAQLLGEKVSLMQRKYPADVISRQLRAGTAYDVVMQQHKEAWPGTGNGNGRPIYSNNRRVIE